MKNQKTPVKGKASALVKVLYVIAAVLMAICVYMVIINIMYINTYTSTYGIAVSDMMTDAIQYIITGSISYFIYGVLVFCSGKIIRLLQQNAVCCGGKPQEAELTSDWAAVAAKCEENHGSDCDTAVEAEKRIQQADNESEQETSEEIQEDKKVGFEQNEIPESEDAVEETEIIEDNAETKDK